MSTDRKSWNSSLRPRSPKKAAEIASGKHKQKPRAAFAKLTKEQVEAKGKEKVVKMLARGKVTTASRLNDAHDYRKKVSHGVLASLDGQLVTLHSQVVRLRARNEFGMVVCFICGRQVLYEEAVLMHYQPRKERGTRFSDVACQAGCTTCNNKPNGDRKNFARRLNEEYGEGTSSRMDNLSKQVMHFDRFWYTNRIGLLQIEKEQLLKQ